MNKSRSDSEYLSKLNYEGLGWGGGKTTLDISHELRITESAVRKRLKRLESEGRIYSCAPRKAERTDGKNGKCLLWFLVSNETREAMKAEATS